MDLLGASAGQLLLDLTVGAGGHARAWLEAVAPDGRVIGCDRDPAALELAAERLADLPGRFELRRGTSVECLARAAEEGLAPDAILLDLGVSSMQLDDAGRGFSLREDALLDMRMDTDAPRTAADVLNECTQAELERAFGEFGGEPKAGRLARAIVERRGGRPFRTTGDLRELVEQVLHRRGGRIHPATRCFQGLRVLVNDELSLLAEALPASLAVVRPGGRVAALSFHSGEDRLVKHGFRQAAREGLGEVVTRRPVSASATEQRENRRSRSAHLRVFRRAGPGV